MPTRRTAAAALVSIAVLFWAAPTIAGSPARAATAAPRVVISPLPGTFDANPETQISFLGALASHLRNIVVVGSRSGPHAGRMRYYSTHTGGSFLPDHQFEPGEHVTATATLAGYGALRQVSTHFVVGDPIALPPDAPRTKVPVTAHNVMHFHSRNDLEPAAVTVTTPAADPTLGDILTTIANGPGQAGAMIVDPTGALVWFRPLPFGTKAYNLQQQSYKGAPVLTWFEGRVNEEHGVGVDIIESSHYTRLATVRAGNGLAADLHDFQITPQGTAWITAYAPQRRDLRAVGGLPGGIVDDGVVQEIDIKTGLVMFEWHAFGNVTLTDSYSRAARSSAAVYDYFHLNSVQALSDGTLLLSSRNTWAVYRISEATGRVLWRLGGKRSTFKLGAGLSFAWQHDARLRPDGTISLFNNEADPSEASQSSALDIAIDTRTHTATLVHRLTYPGRGLLSGSQGDVQPLANGDSFVGWGALGKASEFTSSGKLSFDMRLAAPTSLYRAFRVAWHAQPVEPPALAIAPAGNSSRLYASWNGATDVAGWRVLAGASAGSLTTIGTYPRTGFETTIEVRTAAPYIRVQALSATGSLLRTSALVKR